MLVDLGSIMTSMAMCKYDNIEIPLDRWKSHTFICALVGVESCLCQFLLRTVDDVAVDHVLLLQQSEAFHLLWSIAK